MLRQAAALTCLALLVPATFYTRLSVPSQVKVCTAGSQPVPCARGHYILAQATARWREGPVTCRVIDCRRQPLPRGQVQVFGRVIGSGNTVPPYWIAVWDGARDETGKLGLLVFTEFPTHFRPGLFVGVTCVLRQPRVADAQGAILVLGYCT